MDCKKVEKLLVEYLYRELSAKKTVDVERHLEVCDRCFKTLESWQAIHTGFQKSSEPKASPYLKQRLLAAANEEIARKPSFREKLLAFLKPVVVAPVLVFGFLVILIALFQKQPEMLQAKKAVQAPAPVLMNERDEISRSRGSLSSPATNELKSLGYVAEKESEKRRSQDLRDQAKEKFDDDKNVDGSSGRLAQRERPAESSLTKDLETETSGGEYRLNAPASAAPATKPPPVADEMAKMESPKAQSMEETKLGAKSSSLVLSGVAGSSFHQAQVLFQRNDLKGGWTYANQAVGEDRAKSLAPEFHQAGIQYQNDREYGKAIMQFNLVLDNYPNYMDLEDVLLRAAESYVEIGRLDEARQAYQRLLRISPQNKAATEKLRELNKKQEAQEQLRSLGLENKDQ